MRYVKRFYVRRFANNVNRRMKEALYGNLVRKSRRELEQEGAAWPDWTKPSAAWNRGWTPPAPQASSPRASGSCCPSPGLWRQTPSCCFWTRSPPIWTPKRSTPFCWLSGGPPLTGRSSPSPTAPSRTWASSSPSDRQRPPDVIRKRKHRPSGRCFLLCILLRLTCSRTGWGPGAGRYPGSDPPRTHRPPCFRRKCHR